ncbi:hypothetical protein N9D23_12525 [Rubripirellula sp.]|nr:hypothetical protein [Planctomycetaceae bacterium]MDA9858938.1 hypothetical protein [Rubripirellula sp.]
MTFDQTVGLWCVAVPIAVMLFGTLVGRLITRRLPAKVGQAVLGVSWFAATAIPLFGRQGFEWWPEDAWRQTVWLVLAWALILPATAMQRATKPDQPLGELPKFGERPASAPWRWVVAGTLSCLTGMLVMPSGDAWSDTLPLHRCWMLSVTLSCLWNSYAIDAMARRNAARWCLLTALAGLAVPFALAAATYGSLAEWTLSMLVATFVAVIAGSTRWLPAAWVTAFPIIAGGSIITASARFYSYQDQPLWVYGVALFTPSILATIDCSVASRSTKLRIVVSAIAATTMIGACIWKVLLDDPF